MIVIPKVFIFEGIDFAGKTTSTTYAKEELEKLYPGKVKLYRNPGGTPLGEKIRDIARIETEDLEEQLLAYLLAITSVRNAVLKDIEEGCIVLLDRWTPSTMIYQYSDLEKQFKQKRNQLNNFEYLSGASLLSSYKNLIENKSYFDNSELFYFSLTTTQFLSRRNTLAALRSGNKDRFEKANSSYQYSILLRYQKLIDGLKHISSYPEIINSASFTLEEQKDYVLKLILSKVN